MQSVRCSFDEDTYENMPVLEWARENALFFTGYSLMAPFPISRIYAKKGIMNHGMSGYMVWEPFELTLADYELIRAYFFQSPLCYGYETPLRYVEPECDIETETDLATWRRMASAYPSPQQIHQRRQELTANAEALIALSWPQAEAQIPEMIRLCAVKGDLTSSYIVGPYLASLEEKVRPYLLAQLNQWLDATAYNEIFVLLATVICQLPPREITHYKNVLTRLLAVVEENILLMDVAEIAGRILAESGADSTGMADV